MAAATGTRSPPCTSGPTSMTGTVVTDPNVCGHCRPETQSWRIFSRPAPFDRHNACVRRCAGALAGRE